MRTVRSRAARRRRRVLRWLFRVRLRVRQRILCRQVKMGGMDAETLKIPIQTRRAHFWHPHIQHGEGRRVLVVVARVFLLFQ